MISLTNKTHNYFLIIILKNITFQKHKKYTFMKCRVHQKE